MRVLHLFAIVLLLGSVSLAQQKSTTESSSPGEHAGNVQLRNSDVTVRELQIPAGGSVSISASTPDYLLISFGSSTLNVSGYETSFDLNLTPENMQVLQGGWAHKLENLSNQPVRLLLVEVARGLSPKKALCGLGQKDCHETRYGESSAGEYRQTTLFETETAKLFRVQLGPGVAMHQHSDGRPHLIIAFTEFKGHADRDVFAIGRGGVHWHPGSIAELANDGSAQARFLLLELKKKY